MSAMPIAACICRNINQLLRGLQSAARPAQFIRRKATTSGRAA